jgi:hypothetical protein
MKGIRTYQMTIASTWYDKTNRVQREYEAHFNVARRGRIRAIRKRLAKRGAPYFQRLVYRRFRRWIPKSRLRISFEREERATRVKRKIGIELRGMQYRGRKWIATPFPSKVLSYAKRRSKRKSS